MTLGLLTMGQAETGQSQAPDWRAQGTALAGNSRAYVVRPYPQGMSH